MHRYAGGNPRNVEKPKEFPLTNQYFFMHGYAEGSLGNINKNNGISNKNRHVSCVAVLRDPSEMLKNHRNSWEK